ncbi:MAG: hypothetical protein QNK11_04130 [Legionella sp.]|nr:hypothetical protein [Legionella sp.]
MITLPDAFDVKALYEAILNHNFNQSLHKGTLPEAEFNQFLVQDIKCYLPVYVEVLQQLIDCAPKQTIKDKLTQLKKETVDYETSLHHEYVSALFNQELPAKIPVIENYCEHLHNQKTYAYRLAALTPCLWLYASLGEDLALDKLDKNHHYYTWLSGYADADFKKSAKKMVDLLEQAFEAADESERKKLVNIFKQSLRHELAFFEASYSNSHQNTLGFTLGHPGLIAGLSGLAIAAFTMISLCLLGVGLVAAASVSVGVGAMGAGMLFFAMRETEKNQTNPLAENKKFC